MKLTIDNLNGAGEIDCTALLDATTPPKIVRTLNQSPTCTIALIAQDATVTAGAGAKLRLYRDSGALWFSGYLSQAPQKTFAGVANGQSVYRVQLRALGEMASLDRRVLSRREVRGGDTAGGAIAKLTQEIRVDFDVSGVQDVAAANAFSVEQGKTWSEVAGSLATEARAVLQAANNALTLTPVGTTVRTLNDTAANFAVQNFTLLARAPVANDITVIGAQEPGLYWRDCFTASGTTKTFYLENSYFRGNAAVLVEDFFSETTLDATKWVNESSAALTFNGSGVAANGAAALRYCDLIEMGGLVTFEQTGVAYASGQGIVGGIYNGSASLANCVVGVQLNDGAIQPVLDGVAQPSVGTLRSGLLYEFRTLIFHPEVMRAGQRYASSASYGASARTAQLWQQTAQVVVTMRTVNPADASTLSTSQTVIYDGTLADLPAFVQYEPLWATSLVCTLGHAKVQNHGAVWVRSCV